MKKNKITIGILFILIFFSIPIGSMAAQPQTSQEPTNNFVIGIGASFGTWDFASGGLIAEEFHAGCLEGLIWYHELENEAKPLLATNWTIYERPTETGVWENYSGGVKAIAFSLREGVKFHDGSDFNATVVKWNFDRYRTVSGNETGRSSILSYMAWYDTSTWANFYTPNWNLSWGLGNPNVFGTDNMIPIINNTEIINNYLINVTLNPWAVNIASTGTNIGIWPMISMAAYKDYADKPLPALGLHPEGYPGHYIGTGPYTFDYIDQEVTQAGRMVKFNDYWDRTELEADGWFAIEEINIRYIADVNTRTTALSNGEIDWIGDQRQIPITDHQSLIDDPLINVYGIRYDRAPLFISLLSKEGLNTPTPIAPPYWGMTPKQLFPMFASALGINLTETPAAKGINRTVRQALSYAFNYEAFEKAIGGWGQVSQHVFGPQGLFYNPEVPAPHFDVSKAREILLNDPYYGPLCSARGLTPSSTDAQWNAVAASNPLETHTMLYPGGGTASSWGVLTPIFMEPALASIGCGFESTGTVDIISSVLYGKYLCYDMFPFMMDITPNDPRQSLLWFTSSRRYIPYFNGNFWHNANSTIDDLVYDMQFAALDTLQDKMDIVANYIQNYDTPWLIIERYNISCAMNAGFTFHPYMPYRIGNIMPQYALIGGTRMLAQTEPKKIPGYSVPLIAITSGLSITRLMYVIMRKKRQNLAQT